MNLLTYGAAFLAGLIWGVDYRFMYPAVAFLLGMVVAGGDGMLFVLFVVGYVVGVLLSRR